MTLFYSLNELFGKFSSSRLPIISVIDPRTIQLQAGLGYMSGLRMSGAYRMFGNAERGAALKALFTLLSSQLQQPGCQIQWVTEVNPDQAKQDLHLLTDVSRETWRRLNVDMATVEALITSREDMLAKKAVRENNIATVTTSMQSLGTPSRLRWTPRALNACLVAFREASVRTRRSWAVRCRRYISVITATRMPSQRPCDPRT